MVVGLEVGLLFAELGPGYYVGLKGFLLSFGSSYGFSIV